MGQNLSKRGSYDLTKHQKKNKKKWKKFELEDRPCSFISLSLEQIYEDRSGTDAYNIFSRQGTIEKLTQDEDKRGGAIGNENRDDLRNGDDSEESLDVQNERKIQDDNSEVKSNEENVRHQNEDGLQNENANLQNESHLQNNSLLQNNNSLLQNNNSLLQNNNSFLQSNSLHQNEHNSNLSQNEETDQEASRKRWGTSSAQPDFFYDTIEDSASSSSSFKTNNSEKHSVDWQQELNNEFWSSSNQKIEENEENPKTKKGNYTTNSKSSALENTKEENTILPAQTYKDSSQNEENEDNEDNEDKKDKKVGPPATSSESQLNITTPVRNSNEESEEETDFEEISSDLKLENETSNIITSDSIDKIRNLLQKQEQKQLLQISETDEEEIEEDTRKFQVNQAGDKSDITSNEKENSNEELTKAEDKLIRFEEESSGIEENSWKFEEESNGIEEKQTEIKSESSRKTKSLTENEENSLTSIRSSNTDHKNSKNEDPNARTRKVTFTDEDHDNEDKPSDHPLLQKTLSSNSDAFYVLARESFSSNDGENEDREEIFFDAEDLDTNLSSNQARSDSFSEKPKLKPQTSLNRTEEDSEDQGINHEASIFNDEDLEDTSNLVIVEKNQNGSREIPKEGFASTLLNGEDRNVEDLEDFFKSSTRFFEDMSSLKKGSEEAYYSKSDCEDDAVLRQGFEDKLSLKKDFEDNFNLKQDLQAKFNPEQNLDDGASSSKQDCEDKSNSKECFEENVNLKQGFEEEINSKQDFEEEIKLKQDLEEEIKLKQDLESKINLKRGFEKEINSTQDFEEEKINLKQDFEEEINLRQNFVEKINLKQDLENKINSMQDIEEKSYWKQDLEEESVLKKTFEDKSNSKQGFEDQPKHFQDEPNSTFEFEDKPTTGSFFKETPSLLSPSPYQSYSSVFFEAQSSPETSSPTNLNDATSAAAQKTHTLQPRPADLQLQQEPKLFLQPSDVLTPEEIAEEQIKVWDEQKSAEIEPGKLELVDKMLTLKNIHSTIEENNFEDNPDLHTELSLSLVKIAREVGGINCRTFHQDVIDLQREAMDEIQVCLKKLQMKKPGLFAKTSSN